MPQTLPSKQAVRSALMERDTRDQARGLAQAEIQTLYGMVGEQGMAVSDKTAMGLVVVFTDLKPNLWSLEVLVG